MDERYGRFSRLLINRPHPRVLRVVMNRPEKLNAADGEMHADLTEIWRVIDTDPSVNAVLLTGAGKAFSAGGDLDLVDKMIADFDTRMRVWKEARDMVYNLITAASRSFRRSTARRSAPDWCWRSSPTFRSQRNPPG